MAGKDDYYGLLGISKGASQDEIKKAFRQKAIQYHPDKNPGDKASEEKFKEVNQAYEVLSDSQKKAMYDQYGADAVNGAGGSAGAGRGGFNMDDIFGGFEDIFDFFGGGGRGRGQSSRQQRARGDDLLVKVTISLKDAFNGVKMNISLNREEECDVCKGKGSEKDGDIMTCPTCNGRGEVIIRQGFFSIRQPCSKCEGTGSIVKNPCKGCSGKGVLNRKRDLSVNIPAGAETGIRLKLTGEGSSIKRGVKGDLYVEVYVKPEPLIERRGNDLYFKKTIPFSTMVLGGETSVDHLDDTRVVVKIGAGTENGQIFKIKSQGMPVLASSSRRGDFYLVVETAIPKKISSKAKTLIEQLKEELENG